MSRLFEHPSSFKLERQEAAAVMCLIPPSLPPSLATSLLPKELGNGERRGKEGGEGKNQSVRDTSKETVFSAFFFQVPG